MPVIEKRRVEYDYYQEHQGRKVKAKGDRLLAHAPSRIKGFEKIFRNAQRHLLPGSMVCLGARTGCEVRAARSLGWSAIGIDLHPARKDDAAVLRMDWHNMQFPDNSFDNAYTNSIDHCFDLGALCAEVRRVLRPGGVWLVQAASWQRLDGKEDPEKYMRQSSNYLFWGSPEELAEAICKFGFMLGRMWNFKKWNSFTVVSTKER
jgi:SAM-dependent methyltransferase